MLSHWPIRPATNHQGSKQTGEDVMSQIPQLTVQCRIVGHASPRWKTARSESERVRNNEDLAKRRADAFMKEFKSDLGQALGKYKLRFIENVEFAEDTQPDATAVLGSESKGQ